MRAIRLVSAFSFLLLSATFVLSQSADRHLTSDPSHAMYQRSAYAHGYIHGYEDGFHDADMDIHMGRGERPPKEHKDYREAKDGYHPSFGDKHYFSDGYQRGFDQGYSDSFRGVQFRALNTMRKASEGVAKSDDGGIKEQDFDKAFSRGYDAGSARGSSQYLRSADFGDAANLCQSLIPSREAAQQGEYCDAFIRGFALGFSDGQAGQLERSTQTAQKQIPE